MFRNALTLAGGALLGACATQPPPAPEAPPPVIISDSVEPQAEPVMAAAPAAPQKPQQTDAGRFRVGVASLDSAEAAAPWVGKLQSAGYRTEVLPVTIDGKTWHRVLLPGYASLEEAHAVIPFVEEEFDLNGVWVTSRRRAPTPGDATPPADEPPAEAAPAN